MNRTEYIGKLNALYVGEKNCLEELITIYDEKDKEIERLNKRNKEIYEGFMATTEELCEATKEIERLKDLCDKYEEEHKTTFEEWKKAINIIEEPKKIKKLNENNTNVLTNIIENRKKINEIIDKLNEMGKE